MGDWREHAERREWQEIVLFLLSDAEQAELMELLRRIVPTRKRGHGVETFEGFIAPNEARSKAEYEATLLARRLERQQQSKVWKDAYDCPLDEAIEFAIAKLQERGIKYEGFRGTFLYWHAVRGRWLQIPGSMGAAIEAKRHEMMFRISDYPETEHDSALRRLVAWKTLYPWRMCNSLKMLHQIEAFEPNTPFWHALNIFDWYEGFQDALLLVRSDDGDESFEGDLMDAVESAFEIGRSYEALIKKPFEPHALRGADVIEAAKRGAQETREVMRKKTEPRLEKMKELVPKHGIANAARILAAKGMGSFAANKKLWERREKK